MGSRRRLTTVGGKQLEVDNYEEKEDVFFGLIEIVDSDFKIKFASEDKEKISLNYQGCYKNKVCYPSKMKNIVIKYDKKSISSVKID